MTATTTTPANRVHVFVGSGRKVHVAYTAHNGQASTVCGAERRGVGVTYTTKTDAPVTCLACAPSAPDEAPAAPAAKVTAAAETARDEVTVTVEDADRAAYLAEPRFSAVRIDGRWKVQDAATGETVTCASRAKAEERAAKLNAAEERAGTTLQERSQAPLEVVTLDGTETTVTVEETAVSPISGATVPVETALEESAAIFAETGILTAVEAPELSPAELAAKVAAEAEAEGRYADAREARSAELAERVNAGEMTFDEAAALLITERGTVPAPAAAEPMKSLWVAAAFVPIILADEAPERATLVAKLDASVPNNRGGRTVRLTRAEAEELAAIGTEIENSVNGAGRMAHSARTMRDRLAALWS